MRRIPASAITEISSNRLPIALSIGCGACGAKEFFRPGEWKQHGNARYAHALCPGCHASNFFVVTDFVDPSKRLGGGELFAHPSRPEWQASSDLLETLGGTNAEVKRDYESAVRYFNHRDFAAVVLAARRMLEGLVAQFLPPEKLTKKLARDLVAMNGERDLSPVLGELSNALKDAGNLGAHYGASRVNDDIAERSLLLVEELLKMHFVLKIRVDRLRDAVTNATNSAIRAKP